MVLLPLEKHGNTIGDACVRRANVDPKLVVWQPSSESGNDRAEDVFATALVTVSCPIDYNSCLSVSAFVYILCVYLVPHSKKSLITTKVHKQCKRNQNAIP